MIPEEAIDNLIDAARLVGAGTGRIDAVARQRAALLAWVASVDPHREYRAEAIRVCEELASRMRTKAVGLDFGEISIGSVDLATAAIREYTRDATLSVTRWPPVSSYWIEAARLLARGWSP